MKVFGVLLLNLTALSLVACSSGFTAAPAVGTQTDSLAFGKQLAAQPLCNVEDNGQPFHSDVAIASTFQANGDFSSNELRIERPGNQVTEKSEKGSWTLEKGILTLRNGQNGEVLMSRVQWIDMDPDLSTKAIWKAGLKPGKQKCLKTEALDQSAKSAVHCPCNFEAIVDQAKRPQLTDT